MKFSRLILGGSSQLVSNSPIPGVVGPLTNGLNKWHISGVILTTYDTWDDPPSMVKSDFLMKKVNGKNNVLSRELTYPTLGIGKWDMLVPKRVNVNAWQSLQSS